MHTITSAIPIANRKLPANLYMRPATLYYLRLEFNGIVDSVGSNGKVGKVHGNNATSCGNGSNGNTPLILYKLGYTTTSLHERVHGRPPSYKYIVSNGKRRVSRIAGHIGMGLPPATDVYVISTLQHRNGAMVYAWEQWLHSKYAGERYDGCPPMANGNTELYGRDVLGLDG